MSGLFRGKLLKFLSAIVSAVSLSLPSPAIGASGQLLDQDNNPVADAWIVAMREECRGFGHCNHFCVEVKVVKTDGQGKYTFSSGLRSLDAYVLRAHRDRYLPTYRQVGRGAELLLVRDSVDPRFSKMDAVSARIAHLARTANEMACFTAPQEQRAALIPVYKTMFREAVSIARFPEHHKVAKEICRNMYWTQLRPSNPGLSPYTDPLQQERYLQGIEAECNAPIDDGKEQAILSAIARGDPVPVRSAAQDGFDFNRLLDGRNPPILVAATKGYAAIVIELAAGGAKADVVGENGRTALDQTISDFPGSRTRRPLVVRALLEAGADANRPDIWGYPPLVRVASEYVPDAETFRLLLDHGAHVDQAASCRGCSERGRTVLHVVRDPALARIAIERGANVNAKADFGDTPLMSTQTPDLTRILLEHGADPNIADRGGWTPLMKALQNYESFRGGEHGPRRREIAEILVAAGARLDARNQHGLDAFYYTKDEALKEHLRALAAKHATRRGDDRRDLEFFLNVESPRFWRFDLNFFSSVSSASSAVRG